MDGLEGFIVGIIVATVVIPLNIAWNMAASGRIIMKPVKDEHCYVDIYTNKTYKMENDILYYYEED